MPTGYTAKLYEGEQSFASFVWDCARAFGALVLMRDDASDAPITDDKLTTNHYERAVVERETALAEWQACTPEAQRALYESWVATEAAERKKREAVRVARKERYQDALDRAREWKPPSAEHVGLRKFMIEQLELAIDFDCSVHTEGALPFFAAWCADRTEWLTRNLRYAREELGKERERNESRLRWVRQLRESVPQPEKKP